MFVSANNLGFSPDDYLERFPLDAVEEIHLAGHEERPSGGERLLIDTHDRSVADPVWRLYARVIERRGALPTLIEWDSAIPPWDVLAAEARRADDVLSRETAET